MEDVDYFRRKLYKSLNVPVTRMEAENQFNLGRASEITRDELMAANKETAEVSGIPYMLDSLDASAKAIINE